AATSSRSRPTPAATAGTPPPTGGGWTTACEAPGGGGAGSRSERPPRGSRSRWARARPRSRPTRSAPRSPRGRSAGLRCRDRGADPGPARAHARGCDRAPPQPDRGDLVTPSTDARLRAAERAYRAAPGDPQALADLRAARARAGVPAPVYWLVVPGGRDGRGRLHLLRRPEAEDWEPGSTLWPRRPLMACGARNGGVERWEDLGPYVAVSEQYTTGY